MARKKQSDDEPKLTTRRVRRNSLNQTETRLTEAEKATSPTVDTGGGPELVLQALQRFKLAEEAESRNRQEGLYDVRFSNGDQWPADIKSQRGLDGRPTLTVNRMNQFLNQVANDELENRPAAQVNPVGDEGDPKVAAILQGMMRHIEYDSVAEQVYSYAFDSMLRKGWSWYRVLTEYESPFSFDQKIVIRRIANDFTVYDDPTAILPDRSDANWRIIVEDIPAGEYKAAHGDLPTMSATQMQSVGDRPAQWITSQSVRVGEYYYFENKPEKLFKLANGKGKFESDLNGTEAFELDDNGERVSRMSERRQLKWCKFNCERMIEGPVDIPCPWIPVIYMAGDELNIDGETVKAGMVRQARDPQKMFNFWNSALTEGIALAPKSPFVIAAGQIEGFENYWETANKRNWPYLPYRFITSAGQPAPSPQRVSAQVDTSSISMALAQSERDLMSTMGIYKAGLGDSGPERSGKAILARQKESDTANANYGFNRNWSLLHCWRVILAMIPHIYNSERAIRIIRPSNQSDVVLINQIFKGPGGVETLYDIADSDGKYAVTLSVGAPASRRQQAVNVMAEILKSEPQMFTVFGDLFVSQMDADGEWKEQMMARIKKVLDPRVQEQNGDIPPAVMAKFQEILQQNQMMQMALDKASEIIRTKAIENSSKEYIAGLQTQATLASALIKQGSVEGMEAARQEYARITNLLNLHTEQLSESTSMAHEANMTAIQHEHEKDLEKIKAQRPRPNGSA